ncbi:class I SAM-dependent methyltransferase [Nocardia sp. NPDC057353]|uniref:class I SAM-dependent methyltransferase n=1 Tax=Nocardia sp. NPDC057353 TaxID=3346104 RepID=UPI00362E39F9
MGYAFARSDVAFLGSAAGRAALAETAGLPLTDGSLLADLGRVRRAHGAMAAALVETVRLRRRAAAKLDGAGEWLLTDDALQQATPSAVAGHRATRLAGRAVHDVTCSIGGELAALAETCTAVIGSDIDPVRLAMAAHNLAVAGADIPARGNAAPAGRTGSGRPEIAAGEQANAVEAAIDGPTNAAAGPETDRAHRAPVALFRADALIPCTRDTVVVADPGRRAGGKRTHDPTALQPPLPDLLAAYAGRDLVVKCAPGLDFSRLEWPGEIELVSLDGGVREACLWSPGLTASGITRRATVLRTGQPPSTLTDADPDDIPEREPGTWIVDPDGAVVRAGLVRHYAAKHGLWQLDPRIAYLTGEAVPPGTRGFRVLDRFELREKPLRAELRRRGCGPLEILVRGVDLDPDRLRRTLAPTGRTPYTLVVTRIGRAAAVFLCTATPATPG